MKKVRRITALFLCILMMFPTQAITIFADMEENTEVISTKETEVVAEDAEIEAEIESESEIETNSSDRIAETINVGALDTSEKRIDETLEVEAADFSEMRVEETLKVEQLERIEVTLPIEPLVVWNQDAMIYWNPGGELPAELASASNATKASASNTSKASTSNAKKGRDSADGMSPERPVKTLARALEQAENLKEELGVESSEITIYAMSPMEISDGQLYVMNGANIRIASWPGRSYDNDTIFYVNGGQLSMINALLESGNQQDDPENTQLITVHGGTLQLGQAVEINGQIAMDYRKIKETALWEIASDSNMATRSNVVKTTENGEITSFNIDDYILSTDEESTELIEDTTTASTWCKPVIELMEGYEDNSGEYMLAVNTDTSSSQIELVRTLCADELSGEEFLDYFTITCNDETGVEWNLTAATNQAATIRDTASADTALYKSFEQLLTDALDEEIVADSADVSEETASVTLASTKSLIATRSGSGVTKYWNPGGALEVSGVTYNAGSDLNYDGNDPMYPYKSWEKAVANASGGTIICMQSVTLGNDAQEYIGNKQSDGSFLIQSSARETMVTLKAWQSQPQPVFIVPSGETLVLKNIELSGIGEEAAQTQTVLCKSGDIIIEENVTAETGYIQVNAFSGLAEHPVKINSINGQDDGIITLFFGGINDNLSYRFTDVVVPGLALDAAVLANPDDVGQALLERVVLDTANRDTAHGGQSNFDWSLRQDTDQDGDPLDVNPQNLELYTEYYYDAIYLDGVRGNDDYYGATCQYPVKTWEKAHEIWAYEMNRSIAARAQAQADGQTTTYIEANFPVPKVIYICGTVEVKAAAHWKLEPQTDYDNTAITTEVRSHVDIPYGDDETTLVHDLPKILVEVNNGGNLIIEDIIIRNYTEEKDSITLQVNTGGILTVTGSTQLTGERLEVAETSTERREVTYGTHIQVTAGGIFMMESGVIECREHGVEGVGSDARIMMLDGEIRKNNSYDEVLFEAKDINQTKGAGVVLSDGAAFVMNGGKITQNTVYQYGAGVYLTGSGTSFTMNKGEVSGNKMAGSLIYDGADAVNSEASYVHGCGIGIYADTGTTVTIGNSTSTAADTLVTRNMGYWADGIGVWTDGTLNVVNAAISENYNSAGGYTYSVRKGLGLYAGENAKITIEGTEVTGNYSDTSGTSYNGNTQGAGIYLEYNTKGNEIKNSNITRNIVGYALYYTTDSDSSSGQTYNAGGGIYLAGGVLNIENSKIEENEALYGGGIAAYSSTVSRPIALTVTGTTSSISRNKARLYQSPDSSSYGYGGGIYARGYGTVNLNSGTNVNENKGMHTGGGIYVYGYDNTRHLSLTLKGVQVNQNKSNSGGAGIYARYYTTIKTNDNTQFVLNESENNGGGAIYTYGGTDNDLNKANNLYLTNTNIESNKATTGGGIFGLICSNLYFNNVTIKDNKAKSGNGGGVYTGNYSNLYFNETVIENNTAALNGGGVYFNNLYSNYNVRFLKVTIKDNTAESGNGGGCNINYADSYLTDTKVYNNHADQGMGGGIYLNGGSDSLYFTENLIGGSSLTQNTAAEGGGIYSLNKSVYLDIDGEYQNTASKKGNNLYLKRGLNYIYTGEFKQPSSNQEDGIYNIYLDVTSATKHALYMDPQKVVIEKKAGNPDAVYLNTTNSFLSYFRVPPNNNYGELPIDVNTDVFKEGSIVVKPAGVSTSNSHRITFDIDADGYVNSTSIDASHPHSYTPALTDVADYAAYCSGGSLPRRTQLGGYNYNIVIVGEGIYLDGDKGYDGNDGTSPEKAVKTFGVAKQRLEEHILLTKTADDAKSDPTERLGFSPFIYICGQVTINSNDTWELNYDDDLFLETNLFYRTAEAEAKYTVYDAQVRRFASFVSAPMISVGTSATDVVEFTTRKIIIDGMADAVVIGDQSSYSPIIRVMNQSQATLTGNSRITNNFYNGVDVYGKLILTGDINDENKQLLNHHGYYVRLVGSNASLEMNHYARIVAEGNVTRVGSQYLAGVYTYSTAQKAKIIMRDNSSICTLATESGTGNLMDYGIWLNRENSEVIMQDSSEIKTPWGIYIFQPSAVISMEGNSKITATSYGIYLTANAYNCTISMNKNTGAQDDDSAQIIGYGITSKTYGTTIEMGKKALLEGSGSQLQQGITFFNESTSDVLSKLTMEDNSRITNYNKGIYLEESDAPIQILMKDNAAIEQNINGIEEYSGSSTYGINRLEIEMEGESRISGNSNYGIKLLGIKSFSSTSYHKITMKEKAVIGGSDYYSSSEPNSGNQYSGIYANSPINLEMSGESKISGNGINPGSTDANKYAVTLATYTTSQTNLRATETAYITLKENASICNNNGGIYAQYNSYSSYIYPNPCEITLDGSSGTPSIKDNADAVYLMETDQKIKLKGNAILGASTTTSNGEFLALDCTGSLELDGRSQINGLIYLRTPTLPITMTGKVSDPYRQYRLWLVEGFLGQIVVQPDDPAGSSGGITEVHDQLDYFYKVGGEGMAADKALAGADPNIILMGENNVYLSGASYASDTNTGNSISTPVRTFKRAKELLEGDGYYTSGANIIICNSAVQVLAEDTDWSFDSDGKVTNSQSGQSWKPVVIRYEELKAARLIMLPASTSTTYAQTVSFKNITIDGGSAEGIINTTTTDSELLYVGYGRTAILGEGAVLQNNTIDASVSLWDSVGVVVEGGTLNIEGGIIQNMVRKSTSSTGSYTLSSAIFCKPYSAVYPGKITMKSGKIINNTVDMPNMSNTEITKSFRAGAVSVEYANSTASPVFEMSGGQIEDNQIITAGGSTTNYGGGLVIYNAKATISGGIIRGNQGVRGSAIYYYDVNGAGSMILSGGQITGNITNEKNSDGSYKNSEGSYSPIYVAGGDFQLSGGGMDIQDNIYLNSTDNIIKISGNIYQTGRIYNVFLNQAGIGDTDTTKFQKGSAVVQPDGSWITDTTPYLSYFQVHSNPYILDIGRTSRTTGTVSGVKENQCLILMQAVFLDYAKGDDTNDGTTPENAVQTFTGAKNTGQTGIGSSDVTDYYVIYVSGKATNTENESTWTLPEPAYMCRYTGFQIYNSDGSQVSPLLLHAYHGYLIEPSADLTFDGVAVYGRRSIDTVNNNGESLVNVKAGITVTVEESTVSNIFGRNYNLGGYTNPDTTLTENLSAKGGAFHVESGGYLYLLGGIISDTNAAYGSAVYLEADKADKTMFGHLYLKNSPSISGSVYLSGTGNTTAAYIEPDASYIPAAALDIVIENDYDGRWIVKYPDGTTPGYTEKEYYNLEDSIKALYDVVNGANSSVLQLDMRNYIYLDGQAGDDENGNGKTPETAFRTIKRVYQAIAAGGEEEGTLVFVVDTVAFDSSTPKITLENIQIRNPDGTSSYQGWYEDASGTSIDISGQVYFKRYAQPDGYAPGDQDYYGFNKPDLMDTLFRVESGGELELNGIYLDGHSQASEGSDKLIAAAGLEAESPLVTVMNGGTLICGLMKDRSSVTNGVDTATVFTNNVNVKAKSNRIGWIDSTEIFEGSGAGIELLGGDGGDTANPVVGSTYGGKAELTRTQFSNLSLGSNVIGGTDVYSFGNLIFSDRTFFSGTVYLEGLGSAAAKSNYETSHYLTIDLYGWPAETDFQVLMRDPYNGRTVVYYNKEESGPSITEVGRYRLEEKVKEFFYLTYRDGAPYVLELQVPVAVYIDGLAGDDADDIDNRIAGSTPDAPVKTLKRAFSLLSTRSGNTIYVVGPIQITDDTYVTGTTYTGIDGTVTLGSTDKVKFTRYIQPDFAYYKTESEQDIADAGYSATDYEGVLLEVKDGATASFGSNIYFDGHRQPRTDEEYAKEAKVDREGKAKAPLISVESGGALNLYSGTTLMDNLNIYDPSIDTDGKNGSVLYNSGATIVDGALFKDNEATAGADIYQDGTFTIKSAPENLSGNSFYLTTENSGTESEPAWGTDHIIQTYAAIPDEQTFKVDMDHAVKGRDVVKFLDTSAYDPDADAEYDHFILGSTVPEYLFLVEAANDSTVLELQNWEILDVDVPQDIYLVIHRNGSRDVTTALSSVRTEADGTDLLTSPEYTITNNGRYDVKVSVTAFENLTTASGITHDEMTLVDLAVNALGEKDLYLGLKGMDSGSSGLTAAETSLQPYAEATVTAAPAVLGTLNSGASGGFKFVGAVGIGFIEKYIDSTFPIDGSTREEVQDYMDGTSDSGIINARAKYAMKFKLEIVRSGSGTGSSTTNP